ncbi:hypothetical protein ACT5YV_08660 [Lactiplantibacillus plantarum]|uniref:hypothetical protein n=1 Tax=Lactiplantibacillus plantarum TaxID=1590 RepID=UPI0040371A3E
MPDESKSTTTRHRERFRIEATATDKLAVDYIKKIYGLTTAAECYRRAMQDEVLLLKYIQNPASRSALQVLSREHSGKISALSLALFSGDESGADELDKTRSLLEDLNNKLDAVLYQTHALGVNINQVTKLLNVASKNGDKIGVTVLQFLVGLQRDVIDPLQNSVTETKEVIHHGSVDQHPN